MQREYARLPLRIRFPRLSDCLDRIERALDAAADAGIPVVCVQHAGRPGGPVFDPGGRGFELCPRIEGRCAPGWKRVVKRHGSIYAGTGLEPWLRERGVDTVTLVGFMANNCILASAAQGEALGLTRAVANYKDPKVLLEASKDLGEAMVGINEDEIKVIMSAR